MVLRLRGGNPDFHYHRQAVEMGIAAGGNIRQAIVEDRTWDLELPNGPECWDTTKTKVFNVQILNTVHFRQVTGIAAPKPPVSAQTYAAMGLPFFSMYEEPTDVSGDFGSVRSVAQIDGKPDSVVKPARLVKINRPAPLSLSSFSFSSFFRRGASPTKRDKDRADQAEPPTTIRQPASQPALGVPRLAPRISRTAPPPKDVGLFNPRGPMREFRSLGALKRQLREQETVVF